MVPPPPRKRDESFDDDDDKVDARGTSGKVDAGGKHPQGLTTPVKAPRLEKSVTVPAMRGAMASAPQAFACRAGLTNTPEPVAGLTSSGEKTPASTSAEFTGATEVGVDEQLAAYDQEIRVLRQSQDVEEMDMVEADARRRQHAEVDAKDHGWNANFKLAVHEGGRRLFAQSFKRGRPFDECMKMCFSNDDERIHQILSEFGASASELNVSYRHVMGEALELMVCYLSKIQHRVHMRDYLVEESDGRDHKARTPFFVECEVYKCFMSSAPAGSPWRMAREDCEHLVEIFGGCEDARQLAERLYDQSQRDRFFDVLLILKDLTNDGRFHIQAVQCKARTQFEAYIDISKYVGHQFVIANMAEKLNSLVRLDWIANTYCCKQAEPGGDYAEHRESGRLNIFLFDEMLRDLESIYDAATMASSPFGSKESETVPERPRRSPRECQSRALEKLKAAREELMLKSVSTVCATGIGKTLIACMDATSVLYDDKTGDSLTKQDQVGMIWFSPFILLVEQSAESFSAWEESELKELAKRRRGGERLPIPYYYVVCSKQDAMDKPSASTVRRITNGQLCDTLLAHAKNGDLGRCRFFTTIQGGSIFWNQVVKYIRLSRGVSAPISDDSDPLFHIGIVDEAHRAVGNSAGSHQLCYNIPCQWRVSYSATPKLEEERARVIMERLKEENENDEAMSDASDIDEAFEDAAEDTADPGQRHPHEYFRSLQEVGMSSLDDPVNENGTTETGLAKIQLLSQSLQFIPLDVAARSTHFQDASEFLASLENVVANCQKEAGPSADDFELALGKQVVLFKTYKENYRGRCTCGRKNSSDVDVHQCHPRCASTIFPAEVLNHERYRCYFHYSAGNFVAMDQSQTSDVLSPDCAVLGWESESRTLSVRDGPPRGMSCHDFSGFGVESRRNLIGSPIFTYTFAEAFRFQSPDGSRILARPCLVTYKLNVPDEAKLNKLERERLVTKIFGVTKTVFKSGKERHKTVPLKQIGLHMNFLPSDGPISVTTQDYATVMTIYRLIEREQARKIIVFASVNDACRRLLALFTQFLRKRIEQAQRRGEHALKERLCRVHAAHYWGQWKRDGQTDFLEMRVRQKILQDYRMGDVEVLFNAEALSTGVDLPSTDAVVLTGASPEEKVEKTLQRWGRALRSVPGQHDKRGILAIVTLDPRENEEDKARRRDFFGFGSEFDGDVGGTKTQLRQFRQTYRIAEAAAHESNYILGETVKLKTISTSKEDKKEGEKKSAGGTSSTRKKAALPNTAVTVHSNTEDVLCDMFDIVLRDLLNDP